MPKRSAPARRARGTNTAPAADAVPSRVSQQLDRILSDLNDRTRYVVARELVGRTWAVHSLATDLYCWVHVGRRPVDVPGDLVTLFKRKAHAQAIQRVLNARQATQRRPRTPAPFRVIPCRVRADGRTVVASSLAAGLAAAATTATKNARTVTKVVA